MAKTAEQALNIKGQGNIIAFPVLSGETIYKGTMAVVNSDGLLTNLTSTTAKTGRVVAIVTDGSANATGPAATTASGSISGTYEEASAVAGDKTVRECYTKALVLLTFTSIVQSDVGKTVYASDNYTVDEAMSAGIKIGTLVQYISATSGWVDLNTYYNRDGSIIYKGSMTAVTGTTANGVFSLTNPTGEPIIVEDVWFDITTGSSGAALIDVGMTNNGTASNDTLLDGVVSSLVKLRSMVVDKGTNGGIRKVTGTQVIGGTATATLAGLVGTYAIKYRLWE